MIYISIVSHNHANVILQLGSVEKLSKKYNIIITDNTGEVLLENFCKSNGIWYLKNDEKKDSVKIIIKTFNLPKISFR